MTKGIDLSAHNGIIDFDKLKNNVDFVILRAGFGKVSTQKDKMFETYYKGCKDNNIPVGVYWFSYALTASDAMLEAKACMECIKGKQFEYPIYFDIETPNHTKLTKTQCTNITNAFCTELEKNNYWCGVYSMYSFFKSNLDESIQSRYAIWVARVENIKPTYTNKYQMWQYSWKGKFDGIKYATDCNYCYADYPTSIKKYGKNGFNEPIVNTPVVPVINTKNYYNAPVDMDYATDMSKNVITTYKYSRDKDKKLSKHFKVSEFASMNKSTGRLYSNNVKVSNRLIQLLEKIYADFKCSKIIITSGYRTSEHEKAIGGNANGISRHTEGLACDCVCYNQNNKIIPAKEICMYLEGLGNVYGIGYISCNATHIDCRIKSKQWWGTEILKGCPNILKIGYKSFKDYFNKNGI